MLFTEDRLHHSLGVANKMKALAEETYPDNEQFAQDMFTLGLLHDIGYRFTDKPEEHPEIGAGILKRNNYEYWREVHHHGKSGVSYHSEALNILNTADLMTDRKGNPVTVSERLNDIMERYGEYSNQYRDCKALAKELNLI